MVAVYNDDEMEHGIYCENVAALALMEFSDGSGRFVVPLDYLELDPASECTNFRGVAENEEEAIKQYGKYPPNKPLQPTSGSVGKKKDEAKQ